MPCAVTAAMAEAELGKKESMESWSPELDQVLKKQRIAPAETLPPAAAASETRKITA